MTTFHKAPTRPKLLYYNQDEILVLIGIVRPGCRPRLPHSPSLQVVTKLHRFTQSHTYNMWSVLLKTCSLGTK
jgi:hypothetical protein